MQCTWLPNAHVLITDQGNNRIIEVNLRKRIVWQYPGSNTNLSDQLNSPNSAELLENGHILIADENNNRVIRVSPAMQIVASYGLPLAGGPVDPFPFGSNVGYDLLTTQKGLYSPYYELNNAFETTHIIRKAVRGWHSEALATRRSGWEPFTGDGRND